ncbi:3-dehydroquinate synthase [uncultured Tyzzerella sp.]|uniref:3-dehydroquinate synthase n=1 Tax=uncultured Tyzzerella sp. TaxID=2321398 RepID=UPI002941BBCE|nr:3-dehydroquinate synthase [uncultured Tyzzerella sp.]
MYTINIDKKYNIYIEKDFNNIKRYLIKDNIEYNNVVIITDDNVCKYYLQNIKESFLGYNVFVYTIKYGEQSKNLNQIYNIYEFLLNNNIDRKSLIVALGGGVVGDISGFVAATYMRGIKFIQVPTTLLSQVDSSIGGKTGVDFLGKKNIIGSFYNPSLVYINISTLNTLPKEQFENGMAEVIKHGYILDKDYLNFIIDKKEEIKNYNKNILAEMIYKSCKIKANIVSIDEKEKGIREILNFGHTFGHSIETESNFDILHGQGVAIGIIASMYISYKKGYILKEDIEKAKEILKYFNIYSFKSFNIQNIYNNMVYDKKNDNKQIKIIMLKKIGQAFATNKVSQQTILDAIKYSLEG